VARIRTIKPDFTQSESVGRLTRDARLLFIQIWTIADDGGRCRGNSRFLASSLFPYDKDAVDLIEGWLRELEKEGMIRRYVVNGSCYLDIPKWSDHQRIDKPRKSILPPFQEDSGSIREASGNVRDSSCQDMERERDMEREVEGDGTATGKEVSCSETAAPSSEPPPDETSVLEYPCDGKKTKWTLTRSQSLEWSMLYPSLDIEAECRKALAWVLAKPSRKKTYSGMPVFLVNWLNRAQDGGRSARDGPGFSPSPSRPTTREAPA
jgi:hypothetical protein